MSNHVSITYMSVNYPAHQVLTLILPLPCEQGRISSCQYTFGDSQYFTGF